MQTNNYCSLLEHLPSNEALVKKLENSGRLNFFLMNIDNFSNINHAYGYKAGNRVLEEVYKYINISKPSSAISYRFCSDKFVLVDERELNRDEVEKIAEQILSFFSQLEIPINNDSSIKISLSVGVSIDAGIVNISQAELAIKELRKFKRNHFNIFDPFSEYTKKEVKNIYWIHKIKDAVEEENIVAYFQPIINNVSGKIEKFECLARINDDDEIISPYLFLEAARVTGNLPYVTRSLIVQSFKKFSDTDFEFSLNITAEDLMLDYLEGVLLKNAKKYNIDPSRIVLEMLEDITTLDQGTMLAQITSLRNYGFKIAIDDFGAANSNFSRLIEVHPDYVKIDGAFIKNIVTDLKSQVIVEAIVMICKRSGIKVIAEYIHSKEVQEKVKELGIDYSQGFYFGEPSANLKVL